VSTININALPKGTFFTLSATAKDFYYFFEHRATKCIHKVEEREREEGISLKDLSMNYW
jgi:hypothetical protein